MGVRTNFQRVLNRLEAQRADNRIPHTLNEEDGVEVINKKSGDTYFVKKFNPKTQTLASDSKKEKKKEELSQKEREELDNYTKDIKGHTGKKISEKSVRKDIDKKIEKVKSKLENLDEDQKEEATKLISGMEEFANAKTPEEKEKAIKGLVDNGLIKRNNAGTGTVKIYIDPKTGLDYKAFGENSSLHQSITAYDQKKRNEGGELIPTLKKSNMGGKAMNPNGIFKDKDGKVLVTKIGTKKLEGGGINIGGVDIEKNPDPREDKEFDKKLRDAFTEDGKFDEKGYNEAKDAVIRNNKIVDEVENVISEGDLEVLDPLPGTKPDTPENAKKIANAALGKTADKMEEMILANSEDKKLTKDQKEIIDRTRKLQELDGEEFEKEMLEVLTLIEKNPATDSGFADMCESFSYMSELKKGRAAYLPKGGNFPLGDLVSIQNGKLTDEDFADPKKLREKVKLIHTNVENRSIKAKGGAASSSGKKAELSTYKDGVNKKTGEKITGEEIKQDLQDINDKSYFATWDAKDIESVNKEAEKINELAEKYGLDTSDPEYKKSKKKSIDAAMAKVKSKRAKNPEKYPPLTAKEEKLMQAKMETYYDMGKCFQKGYNENMDSQLYTNEDFGKDKETGKVTRSQTDGKCIVSEVKFEFNVGFSPSGRPTNRVPTRFHNVDRCKD